MTAMRTCDIASLTLFLLSPSHLSAQQPGLKLPAISARTFIPDSLEVPAFTPPEPVEAEPLPEIRIDSSVTVPSVSGTTLTIQRGEASTLPDIPPPPPPEPVKPARKPTAEELAQQVAYWRHSIRLGASVYDHTVSEVQWTDRETKTSYQAICGFDIGLIAGIGSFVRDGESYSVDLLHSDFDSENTRHSARKIPAVSPGQILITQGDPAAPYATAPLHFIKELIDSDRERLTLYQARRKQQQREAAAWAAAHPPVPKDETFIFRPHRGSRYITNPQPEKGGATR